MDEIAANLATLTNQLNRFKPVSVADVSGSQEQLSSAVDERINLQSQRIDTVSESMQEAHKTAQENSEILHDLLVGMENLGESVKQLQEEVNAWGGPEDQEVLNDLMKEVPMVPSISEQPQAISQSPTVTLQIPSVMNPILSNPTSGSISAMSGSSSREMQERLTALKTGQSAIHVSESGAQGNVQFSTIGKCECNVTIPWT